MEEVNMELTADDYFNGVHRLQKASPWKDKTQQFVLNRLTNINKLKKSVEEGTYTPDKTNEFTINENGHVRSIKALSPKDMVLQHTINDAILTPTVRDHLIYDTGSGLKGRGLSFTRRRFETHLHRYYNEYGHHGYALMIDFSKYFDNISHERFISQISNLFSDKELTEIITRICTQYEIDVSYSDDEDIENKLFNSLEYLQLIKDKKLDGSKMMRKSLGIGAPISQLAGLIYPCKIDSYVKTVLGIKYYDVYMDDRIILHPDKQYLYDVLDKIIQIASDLGIFINPKKTKIVNICRDGFTWLKIRYKVTPTGTILKKLDIEVFRRERRKLYKFAELIDKREMTREEAINQYKSWRNDKAEYNCFYALARMDEIAERTIHYERTNHSNGTTNGTDGKNEGIRSHPSKNIRSVRRAYLQHFRNW